DFFGEKHSGMDGVAAALETSESMMFGNPLSVLLTADSDGWQSDTKQQLLKKLFSPHIQLHIVVAVDDKKENAVEPLPPIGPAKAPKVPLPVVTQETAVDVAGKMTPKKWLTVYAPYPGTVVEFKTGLAPFAAVKTHQNLVKLFSPELQ